MIEVEGIGPVVRSIIVKRLNEGKVDSSKAEKRFQSLVEMIKEVDEEYDLHLFASERSRPCVEENLSPIEIVTNYLSLLKILYIAIHKKIILLQRQMAKASEFQAKMINNKILLLSGLCDEIAKGTRLVLGYAYHETQV